MHAAIAAAGFALGASAAILPRQQCCFSLTASGGQSGSLSQLDDGQNRIGGSGSPAQYCINNGAITDGNGRGCILTPPTTQFQCDAGASPTSGFSISGSGGLQYNGDSTFYACPASDSEYNIYTTPVSGQSQCVQISLSTGGQCSGSGASGSASASAPASSAAASSPAASAPAGSSQQSAPAPYTSQASAPASSAPASSTPAASAPASSVAASSPAASAPAGSSQQSAPAPYTSQASAPASSAPASSAPAASAPASSVAASSPAASAPAGSSQQSAPAPYTSQASVPSAPVSSAPAQTTTYACNPAHQYPAGQTCTEISGSLTLVTQTSQATVPAASTPAASNAQSTPAASAYSSAPVASQNQPSGTQPAAASGSACQTSLSGAYQTPHLIVPVSSNSPDQSYGTSYNGQVNSTTSTVFNFDIPQSYEGKQCSIVFLFPNKQDLETSDYTFSGSGSISFFELSSAASQQTTWNSCPKPASQLGSIAIQPGNSYVVATEACKAGQTESIQLSSEGGMALNFFEDWNPASLGLYITSC